jgi:hypothetical protein
MAHDSCPSCPAKLVRGKILIVKKKVFVWVPESCVVLFQTCVCVCVRVCVCVPRCVCVCVCVYSSVPHPSPPTESEGCPLNRIGARSGRDGDVGSMVSSPSSPSSVTDRSVIPKGFLSVPSRLESYDYSDASVCASQTPNKLETSQLFGASLLKAFSHAVKGTHWQA